MSKISSVEPVASEYWTAGGPLWVNFANSIGLADKGMTDVVASPHALVWWLGVMGLNAPDYLRSEDLAFAAALRESFARVIHQWKNGAPIGAPDLELMNGVLAKQRAWTELVQRSPCLVVRNAHRANETIEQALGPVVESLGDTLVKGECSRLRLCAHPDCVLHFYDDSKNGARRWCTMSGCGNRAKVAAFLQRKKTLSS